MFKWLINKCKESEQFAIIFSVIGICIMLIIALI